MTLDSLLTKCTGANRIFNLNHQGTYRAQVYFTQDARMVTGPYATTAREAVEGLIVELERGAPK